MPTGLYDLLSHVPTGLYDLLSHVPTGLNDLLRHMPTGLHDLWASLNLQKGLHAWWTDQVQYLFLSGDKLPLTGRLFSVLKTGALLCLTQNQTIRNSEFLYETSFDKRTH